MQASFDRTDAGKAPSIITVGLVESSLIATPSGWRAVERLCVGDTVLSQPGGMLRIVATRAFQLSATLPARFWPVCVPATAFGSVREVLLLAEQPVLLADDGEPAALVPARLLDGWRGIRRVPLDEAVGVVQMVFDRQGALIAGAGLHLGAEGPHGLGATAEAWIMDDFAPQRLAGQQARDLVLCCMAEDVGEGLACAC